MKTYTIDKPKVTNQELFDEVVNHLLTQNARSLTPFGACAYRGYNGMKCAVGCLIEDSAYDSSMESYPVMYLKVRNGLKYSLTRKQLAILVSLQVIHDEYEVSGWVDKIREIAGYYNLQFNQ